MNRRTWVASLSGIFIAAMAPLGAMAVARAAEKFPLAKSREEWKKLLSAEAFRVLFDDGTERAGSSPLIAE